MPYLFIESDSCLFPASVWELISTWVASLLPLHKTVATELLAVDRIVIYSWQLLHSLLVNTNLQGRLSDLVIWVSVSVSSSMPQLCLSTKKIGRIRTMGETKGKERPIQTSERNEKIKQRTEILRKREWSQWKWKPSSQRMITANGCLPR